MNLTLLGTLHKWNENLTDPTVEDKYLNATLELTYYVSYKHKGNVLFFHIIFTSTQKR